MELIRNGFGREATKSGDFNILGSDIIPKGKIMQISYAYFKPKQGCPCHEHYDLHEVFVCDKGKIDAIIDGNRYEINSGDVLIVRPHHSHEIINNGDITCEMLCIGIACPN